MNIKLANLKPSVFSENIYSTEPTEDLIASIQDNGILQPIWVSPDNVIIAGHRRVNACKILNMEEIPAEVKEYSDLLVIESNRYRDKTLTEKLKEGEALEKILKPKAKEKQKEAGGALPQNSAKPPIDVREETAQAVGISHDTLYKAKIIARQNPEAIKKIDAGLSTVHREFKKIKFNEAIKPIKEAILPEGVFDVIVIDPPWNYGTKYDPETRRVGSPYPEMDLGQLKELKIPAHQDCVLWLWTTNAFMHEAYHLLEAWDFEPKGILTWCKNQIGVGYWLRGKTEHCILAIKGKPFFDGTATPTYFVADTREHSRKPDEFYEIVEKTCRGKKLDMFSREKRQGFEQYGNETEKF